VDRKGDARSALKQNNQVPGKNRATAKRSTYCLLNARFPLQSTKCYTAGNRKHQLCELRFLLKVLGFYLPKEFSDICWCISYRFVDRCAFLHQLLWLLRDKMQCLFVYKYLLVYPPIYSNLLHLALVLFKIGMPASTVELIATYTSYKSMFLEQDRVTTMTHNQITDVSQNSEALTLRAMRWFFLVLIALWTFTAMVLPIVSFSLTKNPLSFSLFGTLAPPLYILFRITKYLFPKSEKDYTLDELKILHAIEKQRSKKQVF